MAGSETADSDEGDLKKLTGKNIAGNKVSLNNAVRCVDIAISGSRILGPARCVGAQFREFDS